MGFGFSKSFVIFIFLSIFVGIGSENAWYGVCLMGAFIIFKIVWGLLTK